MKRRPFLAALGAMGLGARALRAQDRAGVVFLVRHAEKTDDGRDPPLSEAGRDRARQLVHVLGMAGITKVWSTNYERTRSTAAPLATSLRLDVTPYDPMKLNEFAEVLRGSAGRHLVIGHSNTTPDLVRFLGGDPGLPIPEWEYDRLYAVVTGPGPVMGIQLRYGATSTAR